MVLLTAAFAFLNGFRDVSTSVALAVRNRALTPTVAVLLAAFFNFVGALAERHPGRCRSARRWICLPSGTDGLTILVSGLLSACAWGLLMWWRGIPVPSTHTLVGGLAGAGLASLAGRRDGGGRRRPVAPPAGGRCHCCFPPWWRTAARSCWCIRPRGPPAIRQPSVVNQRFRRSQAIAAGAVAFGHGLQDGQRVSAVLLLALLAAGYSDGGRIPVWVVLLSAVMMTAGTLFGGWRISHTIGYKLTRVDPLRGSVAQIYSALMLFVGALALHWPLSTTHTVTAAVLGAGENQHFSVTNRKLVIRIVGLWILTPVATAALAFVLALALSAAG